MASGLIYLQAGAQLEIAVGAQGSSRTRAAHASLSQCTLHAQSGL